MPTNPAGQIKSRPHKGRRLGSTTTGMRRTGLEIERDGILYVPESFNPSVASPLIIPLHGAGGNAMHALAPFKALADNTGTILLAPESQGSTWDLILNNQFGEDVYWLDEALSDVFALYTIDPKKLALAGFSDGASYALSLGLTNPSLFSHLIAFSPGFAAPAKDFQTAVESKVAPPIFVSHGTHDQVLPIDQCSRRIVPRLQQAGFNIIYREFTGGHIIPESVGKDAFSWVVGSYSAQQTSTANEPSL
jgi:phospholipase/carboxylesterase